MGTLFVVATPIGNIADLTDRARTVLANVSLIACEDTRHSGVFLKRLGIDRPLLSVHAFNERAKVRPLLEALETGDVALISDAGTPGISDPGAVVVAAVADSGHTIVPVPGPSSLAATMSISGFPPGPVLFLGFLPRKASEREAVLHEAMSSTSATFFFESPHRVLSALALVNRIDANRQVVLGRELTKLHEEIMRGTAAQLLTLLEARESIRGEVVVGVAGQSTIPALNENQIEADIRRELALGASASAVAKRISAASGLPRSDVYAVVQKVKLEPNAD